MLNFFIYLALLLLVFYLLSRVCTHYFVESLEILAKKLKMSDDIAGATLMAFGGSAPEFLIVIITLIYPGDHANFGAGAIVGSAVFNILMVVGVAAIIHTAKLSWKPVVRDIGFYISAIIALFLVFQDGKVTVYEALLLVSLYFVYLFALGSWQKFIPKEDKEILLDELSDAVEKQEKKREKSKNIFIHFLSFWDRFLALFFTDIKKDKKAYLKVFLTSLLFISLLSWGLVECAMRMSKILNVPSSFIALTVVAFGTSIPDLIAASFMARKGKGGMAIADALGSNIFDILFGFGAPWLVYILVTGHSVSVATANLHGSVLLLLATVVVIFALLILRKFKIERSAGIFLIVCYVGYLIYNILEAWNFI